MFDNEVNKILKPYLEKPAKLIVNLNFNANQITFVGLIFGIFCFYFIVSGEFFLALIFFTLNRLFDGLDGYVARQTKVTDLGGFYDIVFDFIIYSLVPLGFILNDPSNSFAFSFLLSSFIGTCATFLASALIIQKNKDKLKLYHHKSFFYSRGVAEGLETIICFVLMFLFPNKAFVFAWGFGLLCWITVIARILYIKTILLKIN